MQPYMEIGARLRAVRTGFTDLTQAEFAKRHGFQKTQYNAWETGQNRITVDCAERLAASYGLTLDWIYLGRRDGLADRASKVL